MINHSTILTDNFDDVVLEELNTFNDRPLGREKNLHRTKLISLLTEKNYIFFYANYAGYLSTTIGSSYLYDVPLYKQGSLKMFRGKRVRIICMESGCWRRGYMAGIVGDTPQHRIIAKRRKPNITYRFPDYVHAHQVLYRSPSFIVFRVEDSICIFSKSQPSGYINTDGWDSVLVDGKFGEPIAALAHDSDSHIQVKALADTFMKIPILRSGKRSTISKIERYVDRGANETQSSIFLTTARQVIVLEQVEKDTVNRYLLE